MTRLSRIALACALTLALPLAATAQVAAVGMAASAPGARLKAGEVTVRATVVEVDQATRTATLRGPKGQMQTLTVPPEVKNFEQVRAGDELVVRFMAAVAARLEKVESTGIRQRIESSSSAVAAPGALPGMAAGRTVEVLAVLRALDKKTGVVTLRGATRTFSLVVPDSIDISKLKVGDEVRAVFTEAIAINVERPAAK
jgi:Cu/Ag efflux protein CusF